MFENASKFFFSALFEKNLIFKEHLPPEDEVTHEIWWQTQDLEYPIGF